MVDARVVGARGRPNIQQTYRYTQAAALSKNALAGTCPASPARADTGYAAP